MRVTQTMLTRNTLFNISQQRSDLNTIQEHISSGRKVNKPSDDPTRYGKVSRLLNKQKQNDQYIENVKVAQNWIDNSVSLLQTLDDIVLQAKDIANRGADGQSDATVRNTLANKLDTMINESISLVNSQYLNKSVFAGTDTQTTSPFVYSSGVVSYTGNDKKVYRSYSETVKVAINVPGQDIMDTGVFSGMTDLLTALRNNDETAIRSSIDAMKTAQQNLLAVTSELGARSTNLHLIRSRLEKENIDMSGFLSDARDAKIDEEVVKYQNTKIAYESSLKVTASSLRLNILQYL